MAAALVESDIDQFIKNQKLKLQEEKQYLGPSRSSPRKQWDRNGLDNRLAEQKQRQLQDQFRQEVEEDAKLAAQPSLVSNQYTLEQEKKRLQEERRKEYQDFIAQKQAEEAKHGARSKPENSSDIFANLGQHEQALQKLNDERKQDYNKLQSEQNFRTKGYYQEDEPQASLPGIRPHDSAENNKKKRRNEEYNQFLREKEERERHKFDSKKPPAGRGNVSGRHGRPDQRPEAAPERERSQSQGARKSRQDDLPPTGPKRGWQTPTYEDVLDKKRREEAQYRQDDPEYGRGGMRSYASEGAINNAGEEERRLNLLDKEYDAKVRFEDNKDEPSTGLADLQQEYLDVPQAERRSKGAVVQEYREDAEAGVADDSDNMAAVARGNPGSLPFGTDNNIGDDDPRGSAKKRRQDEYRKELQLQIRETQAARKREKREDLRVNATGLLDPEKPSWRLKGLGDPSVSPRKEYQAAPVKAFHTKFGEGSGQRVALGQTDGSRNAQVFKPSFSDDDGGSRPQVRATRSDAPRRRDRGSQGILDVGFDGLLEGRRSGGLGGPPPGLQYQPSTYVTAGAGAGIPGGPGGVGGIGGSSIDEAYHYYGMKNPLDPDQGGGVPALNLSRLGGGGGGGPIDSSPRVHFDDGFGSSSRNRDRSKERISPYHFASEDEQRSRSRSDKQTYQQELERQREHLRLLELQINEKRMQKAQERDELERYNRKLEDEIRNYNPFGRGGGGAPNKDGYGNAVTDLRQMHADNAQGGGSSYRSPPPPVDRYSPTYRPPSGPKDDLIRAPPVQTTSHGETTYARGGHGIFGNPRTDAEKSAADKYKDDLRFQIADKRRRDQEEREKQRIEDELENRRLEEQRLRMQRDFEEEQRKIRDKEEEARRKNDELRRQAEERKKDQDRQKREAEERRAREQREQREAEDHERQDTREDQQRAGASSPPVPAVRAKNSPTEKGEDSDVRTSSPPLPARREPEPTPQPRVERANSTDVLNQLTIMRSQLQSERRRVENALANQKNEPEVFDPRLVQRSRKPVNPAPVLPPTDDNANPRTLHDFNHLKYRTDTESRRAFRSMFPDAPITNMTLESQQDALLRHQEEQLRSMKDGIPPRGRPRQYKRGVFEKAQQPKDLGLTRQGTTSARSLLQSNSAFIDVDGVNHFPEDFEDMPGRRNESARARRRERLPLSPRAVTPIAENPEESGPGSQPVNPMGSVTSLDIDHIQRKNEDRLRRLQNMSGEDTVSVGDPDDILERFMARQKHNRPPSGQTLQDDSWLRPGSKVL